MAGLKMIALLKTTKAYDSQTVLQPTDLIFEAAKTTVVLGPSGCGKSTILRLIMGLISPDTGSVEINGKVLSDETLPFLRKSIGYVVQEGGLFPHLTNRQNVTLAAQYFKISSSEIQKRLNELAELTHFPKDALDRFPIEISGGQRQRISLMRALMLDPEILLLDEPLGALDPLIRYELQQELKDIFNRLNKTVILVTHDLAEAAFFGDEIVLMKEGRIVQKGDISSFSQAPAEDFVTNFLNAQRGWSP
jgi:osmoprotectant transport system ATP-binding protein